MATVLLAYHSVYGYTRKICERIQAELQSRGQRVDVLPLAGGSADPARYDVIVIGASIRNGKHNPAVSEFIRANQALLESKPSAFFSVNLVARKPGKNTPETNPYVRKFLSRIAWKPRLVGVFGGNLDYPRYGTLDRTVIRLIMWLTGGPTDPQSKVEFTDWDEVRRYAGKLAALATEN
ncbi:MAG: menaquinone-dependent protoporphyrinogen IX dehydrogenase [Steroidobacteraceae bacterium]